MTAFTLGQATATALGGIGARARRAGRSPARACSPLADMPVRRDSIEAGTFEETFFAVPARGETDEMLRVARRTLDAGRRLRRDARAAGRTLGKAERLIAALSAGAVRVYEELLTLARLNRGRVYPSYDHLAEATGLGRATVARALNILEAIGFLARQRRYRRIGGDGPGPRYVQTSNVYRPALPRRVMAYLPRWMRPAPLPVCERQRETERTDQVATMLAGLSCRELATATVGGELGRLLAKLGAGVDRHERESQDGSQSFPSLLIRREVELA